MNQTGNQNPDGQDQDKKSGIDPQELTNIINSAVTAQLKRALPKALEGVTQTLNEAIKRQIGELKPPPKDDDDESKDKAKNRPDPELIDLRQKYEAMQAKLSEAESKREAAEKKRRDDKAYADLRGLLAKGGVRPDMLEDFSDLLFHARKQVQFDDDDQPMLRVKFSPGKGMPEEEQSLPLESGVTQLLKTPMAGRYLPPPGGASGGNDGSGKKPGRTPKYDGPATTDEERDRRISERLEAMGLDPNVI